MIIKRPKSIVPACDVSTLERLREVVAATHDIEGIGGYKIGFSLALTFGIPAVVKEIRELTDKPIIYDHQKAGTDIPDTAEAFMAACAGVDAVILFPQAGPATEEAWIKAAQRAKLSVIVGGEMTHPGYLATDDGYLLDDMPQRSYTLAASLGVSDFVVPGNKPERIATYRALLESKKVRPTFWSPGLVTQGGSISAGGKAAGSRWHAIVGRGITQAPDMRKAAEKLVTDLR